MRRVYACPICKTIYESYVSSCPKYCGEKILEIPFDGKFVMISNDDVLMRKLREVYEQTYGHER